MSDPSLEVQAALVASLKSPGALAAVVGGRVFDTVKANAAFPYITLGEGQVLPDKADCIDGTELSLQIDVWSRAVGFPEAKIIVKSILAKLDDQPLSIAGFDAIVFEHESTRYLRDPDGLTLHAAMTFRALVQPNS